MLVSLIIPVFNVSNYLPVLMESVLSQTHSDIEVILIDDGSSDPSGIICDEYADKDKRVRAIHTVHTSVSDARNKGIEASSGEFIAFVDADDRLAEDYVEYLLSLCTDNGSDISCCAWTIDNNGQLGKCSYRRAEPGLYKGKNEAMRALLSTRLMSSSVWAKMFRRKLFDEIRFPSGSNYYEDDATMYRVVSKADSIMIGGESKYYYRLRDDSLIHRSFNDSNFLMIKIFEERCSFIEENYPDLTTYARSDVLMAVNHCIIKMCDDRLFDHPAIDGLRSYYKRYEKDFLKGISYFPSKLFSVVAFINIRLAMRLYSLTGKHARIN